MTPQERAERAKRLLDDEVLNEAIRAIREKYVKRLEAPEVDLDGEHEIVLALKSLNMLKPQLMTYVNDLTIDTHKTQQKSFVERMTQRYRA